MGNWTNKEWSQIDAFSGDEGKSVDEIKKQRLKSLKKRSPLTNNNQSNLSSKNTLIETESTPNSKNLIAKVSLYNQDDIKQS